MKKINVAIIGVGSFTKALVEGVTFYSKNPKEYRGLIHPTIGGYRVQDINFVAAFDVDERKVGKKLHKAISVGPNVTLKITEPLEYNVLVQRGPTFDSVDDQMRKTFIHESKKPVVDVAEVLKKSKADVVVNLVPTGGEKATQAYAEASLKAGCSFINCIPTPLITVSNWKKRFEDKGLVLIGDDIKSQLGATMLNRILLDFLKARGIRILKSEQENRGGNADHYNLLYRAEAKEKTKREALTYFLQKGDAEPTVKFFYTGVPSGHKLVNIKIEGEMFGRVPISIISIIEDEISINGAGTLVDAIRVAKFLVDSGKQKETEKACPFLMKSPPKQMSDTEGIEEFKKVLAIKIRK
jgi:myo-inositol-1-phosphate synthase